MGTQGIIPPNINYNKNISDGYQIRPYTAGETCIHNNTLYKAKQDITVAEEWNPEHWEETTVEQELSAVNTNIANIAPDDTAVDGKPWTSKHIVDMLCPPLEVSGNPVQCYPVPGYPLGITASWEPTQEGTGDPSPDNIRPIKGRNSVAVIRCGQNLYGGKSLENIAWANDYRDLVDFLNLLPIGAYMLRLTFRLDRFNSRYTSDTEEASALQVVIKRKDDHTIANNKAEMVTTKTVLPLEKNIALELNITSDDVGKFGHVYCYACGRHTAAEGAPNGALGLGTIYNVSISIGSVAPEYTPYQGDTVTLTLPETIYGGSVDAVTGNGAQTHVLTLLTGQENWRKAESGSLSAPVPIGKATRGAYALCSVAPPEYAYSGGGIYTTTDAIIFGDRFGAQYATVEAWTTYLAEQNAEGTPVQVVYKLATPIVFQASGVVAMPALEGINTVFTDADSVAVTGREDLLHVLSGIQSSE